MDLTAVNKAAMMELPAVKKWQIYCSRRPPPGQAPPLATAPQVEDYIKGLNEIADVSYFPFLSFSSIVVVLCLEIRVQILELVIVVPSQSPLVIVMQVSLR